MAKVSLSLNVAGQDRARAVLTILTWAVKPLLLPFTCTQILHAGALAVNGRQAVTARHRPREPAAQFRALYGYHLEHLVHDVCHRLYPVILDPALVAERTDAGVQRQAP